jgi:predicted transcriptional regulator
MSKDRVRSVTKVKEVMTSEVIALPVPNTRRAALKLFVKHPISGIPIVRDDGSLIGIITRKNIFDHPNEEQLAMIMIRAPITIRDTDTVADAARIMAEKNIHRLPVLNKDEKLVGIISPIDCLKVLAGLKTNEVVENFLAKHCVAIAEETPASSALTILEAANAKAMPVINKRGDVTGIVTDRDIYSFALQSDEKGVAKSDIGEGESEGGGDAASWTWEGVSNIAHLYVQADKLKMPANPVKEFMKKEPVTVYGKSAVEKAARHMTKGRFNQLPVTWPTGKLRGQVNELDLLRYLWE